MKKLLIMVTVMLLSSASFTQVVDYTKQEITINYEAPVEEIILYKVIDYNTYVDYYPIEDYTVNGEFITMYISEGINYALEINGHSFIHFTVNSKDIVDKHDVAILNCKDCFFYKDKLTFNE